MLQTKPLQELLLQALSPSIHAAVLATPQGTLITHSVTSQPNSSFSETEARRRHARGVGAIATVIWRAYNGINNVHDLVETSNGIEDEAEWQEGLMWLSIECEVRPQRNLCLTFRKLDFLSTKSRHYQTTG
jgi:hypothetical protein